jgi:hypothetical protein
MNNLSLVFTTWNPWFEPSKPGNPAPLNADSSWFWIRVLVNCNWFGTTGLVWFGCRIGALFSAFFLGWAQAASYPPTGSTLGAVERASLRPLIMVHSHLMLSQC